MATYTTVFKLAHIQTEIKSLLQFFHFAHFPIFYFPIYHTNSSHRIFQFNKYFKIVTKKHTNVKILSATNESFVKGKILCPVWNFWSIRCAAGMQYRWQIRVLRITNLLLSSHWVLLAYMTVCLGVCVCEYILFPYFFNTDRRVKCYICFTS